jgi:hypothetical protein
MTERIILKLADYSGCFSCCKNENAFDCKANTHPICIEFLEDYKWDMHGNLVTVFRKGDVVEGTAVIENRIVYCACAATPYFEGISDFIHLKNIIVSVVPDIVNSSD